MQAGGRSGAPEDVWSDGQGLAQGRQVAAAPTLDAAHTPDAEPYDSPTQNTEDKTPPSQTLDTADEYASDEYASDESASDSVDEYASAADTVSWPSYTAQGNGEFLGRADICVAADGTITFSMDPNDESVQQLATDILDRLER